MKRKNSMDEIEDLESVELSQTTHLFLILGYGYIFALIFVVCENIIKFISVKSY